MLLTRAVLFFLLVGSTCAAKEVKLRLLNGETGTAIADKQVELWFADKDPPQGSWVGTRLNAKTGADGVAVFDVPDPVPKVLFFVIPLIRVQCSSPTFSAEEVFRSGVVARNTCDAKGKLKGKISAQPGEAIAFERPYKFWERLSQ